MAYEIEVKFQVDSFAKIRRRLRNAHAKYLGSVMQTDSYFDTDERTLLSAKQGLRIREIHNVRSAGKKIDKRPLMTFKGPALRGKRAKGRRSHRCKKVAME